ncbi:unnamed protein product [Meloidogyne enterolobii]|uniref:Uncharacterized protein n=1 Tax=Meloidogyne enterolobii TaxID=390850 RepID=A0ACB1B9X7_MELEN
MSTFVFTAFLRSNCSDQGSCKFPTGDLSIICLSCFVALSSGDSCSGSLISIVSRFRKSFSSIFSIILLSTIITY